MIIIRVRCFSHPVFFLRVMNIFQLPATNKQEVNMLVYKGVLRYGHGDVLCSQLSVSDKREVYEAPSDEMRMEARRLLRRIKRKSLTDDELFRLAMYDNTELAEFFASAYVPDYERGSIKRVSADYEIPTASTKSSRLDAVRVNQKSHSLFSWLLQRLSRGRGHSHRFRDGERCEG